MLPSVRTLLSGILDYAGLFPPAQLPLEQAMRRYIQYRMGPDAWMLGPFVCPSVRLPEVASFCDDIGMQVIPLPLSVILDSRDERNLFTGTVETNVRAVYDFQARRPDRVVVNGFELRLSAAVGRRFQQDLPLHYLADAADFALRDQGIPLPMFFVETELAADWQSHLTKILHNLGTDPLRRRGYKLRCGGLHASTFPSIEDVAHVIVTCRDAGVPLKFTAGLHHPLRHYDAGVQTHMHGFLNVFCAGVLAQARQIDEETVRAILADEDASHFVFEEDGFRWNDLRASVEEIGAARREAVISFGSCSFDEPREDLRTLGLL